MLGSSFRVPVRVLALVAVVSAAAERTPAAVIAPPFNSNYTLVDLGAVPGVPATYGGLTLKAGDPNTLLIGGDSIAAGGVIDAIGVTRDVNGHITGFTGTATQFATAPNIDGGLAYGPGGVLFYTTFSNNTVGEIKPGSTSPDKTVSLTGLGVAPSVGTLQFVPAGQPSAGSFKLLSATGGGFYTAPLTPDGSGTYNIGTATLNSTPDRGPEGIVYVPPGSPQFTGSNLLISEINTDTVGAYQVDANGAPIVATRRDFITGATAVEGAFIDPLTEDLLFTIFPDTGHVIEVRGFAAASVPEPSTLLTGGISALLGLGYVACRRRRQSAA